VKVACLHWFASGKHTDASIQVSDGDTFLGGPGAIIDGGKTIRIKAGPENPGFPAGAIYISESGGNSAVASNYSGELNIKNNVFNDNWSGVVLFQNSTPTALLSGSPLQWSARLAGAAVRTSSVVSLSYLDPLLPLRTVSVRDNV
jgi:hypothetical protein